VHCLRRVVYGSRSGGRFRLPRRLVTALARSADFNQTVRGFIDGRDAGFTASTKY